MAKLEEFLATTLLDKEHSIHKRAENVELAATELASRMEKLQALAERLKQSDGRVVNGPLTLAEKDWIQDVRRHETAVKDLRTRLRSVKENVRKLRAEVERSPVYSRPTKAGTSTHDKHRLEAVKSSLMTR